MSDISSLPDMMNELRRLKGDLEKLITDTTRNFEETTGLTVEDIELIRNMEMGKESTRVAGVKITMRL